MRDTPRDHASPLPTRKVGFDPGLHIEGLPGSPRSRAPLACSCRGDAERSLQPALLHKRHQQQSPATEASLEESYGVRGAPPAPVQCPSAKSRLVHGTQRSPLTAETPGRRCCPPAKRQQGTEAVGFGLLPPTRTGGSGQEQEGRVVCSNRWPLR